VLIGSISFFMDHKHPWRWFLVGPRPAIWINLSPPSTSGCPGVTSAPGARFPSERLLWFARFELRLPLGGLHGPVSFVVAECIRSKSEEERLIAIGIWCLFKIKASYLPSLLIRYFCFQKLCLRFGYVFRVFGVVVSVRVPIGRCRGILACDLCL
jgi:hypothetical protein